MRKPSTFSLKNTDDDSDAYSTSAPASTQAYLDDNVSPQDSYNKESDDSDCFSDSSKKIRKKRNAYQKISDEIRMKLLDCVKNGETLKSAAKRFKINYSSAKSILHTFRKEGRILKKSAQERTTKKRAESLIDLEQTPKSSRLIKKNSVNLPVDKISKSLSCLNGKGGLSRETTPVGSLSRLDEGAYDHREVSGMAEESGHHQEEGSHNHYGKMNYYMHHNEAAGQYHHYHPQHHEVGRNYMLTEGLEHGNYGMHYPRDYDSFNDMVSALHHRGPQVDGFFNDSSAYMHHGEMNHHMDEKFFKTEHGHEYPEHGEHGFGYQLKSFMDTQSMFRDALKKGGHVSYSNSNNATAYRKGSMELF